jgi:hypothetical protein
MGVMSPWFKPILTPALSLKERVAGYLQLCGIPKKDTMQL